MMASSTVNFNRGDAMKRVLFFLSLVLLIVIVNGCDYPRGMTNEEIIAEVKKCQSAGMDTKYMHELGGRTFRIECAPIPKKELP